MNHLMFAALSGLAISCSVAKINDGCISKSPGISTEEIGGSSLPDNSVSITVEGGSAENALAIADVLYANGIAGTFFIRGQDFDFDSTEIGTIAGQGHTIANGSFTGEALGTLSSPVTELRQTDYLISPYVKNSTYLFMAPKGVFEEDMAKYLNKSGLNKYTGPITFDHQNANDLDCWAAGTNANDCADSIFNAIDSVEKGIVRLSTSDSKSVNLAQRLVSLFTIAGYGFVPLSDAAEIYASLSANGAELTSIAGSSCNDYD